MGIRLNLPVKITLAVLTALALAEIPPPIEAAWHYFHQQAVAPQALND